MKILILMMVPIIYSSIGNTLDSVSPTPESTIVSAEEANTLFNKEKLFVELGEDKNHDNASVPDVLYLNVQQDLGANNLLKEITKADVIDIYCNDETCLPNANSGKLTVNLGFTSMFYSKDGLPNWKAPGLPAE